MVLQLARVHLVFGVVGRVLVEVGEEDGLGVGGLDVLAAAAVAVPAGADFVVEGAVHFVLLRAEDGGEVAVGRLSLYEVGRGEKERAYLAILESTERTCDGEPVVVSGSKEVEEWKSVQLSKLGGLDLKFAKCERQDFGEIHIMLTNISQD